MLEAVCGKCGETFNPADESDLVHLERQSGMTCGGVGEVIREIPMGEESLMRMQIDAMAEVWQNTGDAGDLYAAMQWVEVASIASVLHAGGRPDVAASVVVWWDDANPGDDVAAEVAAALEVYERAADSL